MILGSRIGVCAVATELLRKKLILRRNCADIGDIPISFVTGVTISRTQNLFLRSTLVLYGAIREIVSRNCSVIIS